MCLYTIFSTFFHIFIQEIKWELLVNNMFINGNSIYSISMGKTLRTAICDVPPAVAKRLAHVIKGAGHEVIYEGPLSDNKTVREADVWFVKWTFCMMKDAFFEKTKPKKGIVSLTVGTDHIAVGDPIPKYTTGKNLWKRFQEVDMDPEKIHEILVDMDVPIRDFDIELRRCEAFSSIAVAEHAVALSFRSFFADSYLPPLSVRPLVFPEYDDQFAVSTVAQMLFRGRQLDQARERVKQFDYGRGDAAWSNRDLTDSNIGIIGQDRYADALVHLLVHGFNCQIYGYDIDRRLQNTYLDSIQNTNDPGEVLERCDYVFLLTDKYDISPMLPGEENVVDPRMHVAPNEPLTNRTAVVLGASGNIGSKIADILGNGFRWKVAAFATSDNKLFHLVDAKFIPSVEIAMENSQFAYITLRKDQRNRVVLGHDVLSKFGTKSSDRNRGRAVLTNVSRADFVDSNAIMESLESGRVSVYATDVIPMEYQYINDGGTQDVAEPPEALIQFANHPKIISTPHEAECSEQSLRRLMSEALQGLKYFEERAQ